MVRITYSWVNKLAYSFLCRVLRRPSHSVAFYVSINIYDTLFILDINECTENLDNCPANSVCQNAIPGFNCICNPGYEHRGDICDGKFVDVSDCSLLLCFNVFSRTLV